MEKPTANSIFTGKAWMMMTKMMTILRSMTKMMTILRKLQANRTMNVS
jgi:hypothetical protein